ncbi:MAG: xanthine dehydrogenase family protein molybdopterin-binding subunit [Phycisphaerae bacterium]|nr:xanthine dehydrogenase family protein molybdopterin-binding subunit [Phycisphaerae bacterium]MDZ4829426.1 xanthine dehydrogenase family protein molybdopterin-binding subunit [Phycisphaerae bacterium]
MNIRFDDLPTSMPTTNRPQNLGSSMNDDASRLDGFTKVTGQAKYGRDQYLPNSLFVGFVRCPVGAAELEAHDDAPAKAVPGVVEVEISGKDGQYQGHSVGYVVAESPAALARGLRALTVKWKRGSVKTRIMDEKLETPDPNDATKDLLAAADHVLEAEYSTEVQTHASLETHGAVIDHKGDSATCYVSTQGTFAATDGLGEAIGLPRSKYEVICEYVGGGFGSKLNGAGKEGVTAAKVAAKYKRPVYCFVSREEDQVDTGNRPSSLVRVKIGFKNDGTVLGGQIRSWGGVGVGRGGGGIALPTGRYTLGKLQKDHTDVRLNAGAPRPFRAPGHPQAAFVEELMLDEMATIAGIDPLELRLKLETSQDRREMMQLGANLIGWTDRQKTGSQTSVLRRGFGMGTTAWGGGGSQAECEVVINRDGSIEARTGTQDIGQGQRSTMGIIPASVLGVPLKFVTVRIGHSTLPVGPGSGGSTTTPSTAPVMQLAAESARKQLLVAIANLNGGDASELDIKDGQVLRSGKPLMSWKDACAKIGGEQILGRGKSEDVKRGEGHSQGVQFVDLTVDSETGVVRVNRVVAYQACGKVIARKLAESQVIGGVIQGLSYALFESRVLDRNVGSMLNANLEMYKIAGSADMPHIEPVLWRKGQTGYRSLGEPPTIPTSGAIACAVFNAIGKPVRSLPITPDKVLAVLQGAKS